ncbi:MAG: Na/Pi cotransporter family protein [Clostridia bacterium]|nr:Na/Pi cotransporter family protein [Clostridia bacterium]
MNISNIIALLCGVALFLFGMTLMGEGLKRVAGNKLELVLYKLSSTPIKGVLLGTGITAVIQSSSATSVMVVGFVNSGMMKVKQAIGVVLGAILGTSITGWIICLSNVGNGDSHWLSLLSTATITGIIAVIGIILRMFCKKRTQNHIGDILMGFSVLMTGMTAMSTAVAPLRESEFFLNTITSFKNPLIGIIVGLLITCVLQSASATVGILQALSMTGSITFEIALPIIMGIAIGAAVPVLLSALGASTAGKRVALVYLVIDVVGAVFWAAVFYSLNAAFHFSLMDATVGMVGVSLINTVFRLATVLLLAPFIGLLEYIVKFFIKDNPEDLEDAAEFDRLEDRFLSHPAVALEQSSNAVCSMARKARKNLSRAIELLYDYSDDRYQVIQNKEDIIDKYEDKLGTYLVKLTGMELSAEQGREISKILHTIGDFERIGDHAVNISNTALELHEKKLSFSPEAQKELDLLASALSEIVLLATDSFTNNDVKMAQKVEPLEQVIDGLCDEIKIRHIQRVRNGVCTLDQGFSFNDILTNFERIADHCSNIAVALIELNQNLFDTHAYLSDLKTARSQQFVNDFNRFNEAYHLEA